MPSLTMCTRKPNVGRRSLPATLRLRCRRRSGWQPSRAAIRMPRAPKSRRCGLGWKASPITSVGPRPSRKKNDVDRDRQHRRIVGMASMKAVLFRQYGGPEVLRAEEVQRPEPGPRDVLVKIYAAGICYHDILS